MNMNTTYNYEEGMHKLRKMGMIKHDIVLMYLKFYKPKDYSGPWPATAAGIGKYAGMKYLGRPLSAQSVWRTIREVMKDIHDEAL